MPCRRASGTARGLLNRIEDLRYSGNPEHKRNPGDFGLTPPSGPRPGKTLCDQVEIYSRAEALALLKAGVRRGISAQERDDHCTKFDIPADGYGRASVTSRQWDNESSMTVRLDLRPDVEANLAAQARARGVPLEVYLQRVIEDLARSAEVPPASLQDLEATLDALAEMGRDLPHLPSSAFSRENIYRDHD